MASLAELITETTTLWILLLVVAVVFITLSAVIHFHWASYAPSNKTIRRTQIVYYSGALLLFAGAALILLLL